MSIFRWFLFGAVCWGLVGCSELGIPKRDTAKAGPFFTPSNFTNSGPIPAQVRRVAVLPSSGGQLIPEQSLNDIDEAITTELNRTGRFETVRITRDQLHELVGVRSLSSIEPLPANLAEKIRHAFGADAMLFTDITAYSAYPPLEIGLRMKLAELNGGSILWASDNIFSAANPDVANSARRHALQLGLDRSPGDLSHTILQNPARYAAYAAAATFQHLPPR